MCVQDMKVEGSENSRGKGRERVNVIMTDDLLAKNFTLKPITMEKECIKRPRNYIMSY